MDPIRLLTRNPAVGLGVSISIGLALGTGALGNLLPSLSGLISRPPAPEPAAPAVAGGPVARPATSDVAAHLDAIDLDQDL